MHKHKSPPVFRKRGAFLLLRSRRDRSPLLLSLLQFLRPELFPEDLADVRLGKLLAEFDLRRELVGGQLRLAVLDQLFLGGRLPSLRTTKTFTLSPRVGWGMPMEQASWTLGWR